LFLYVCFTVVPQSVFVEAEPSVSTAASVSSVAIFSIPDAVSLPTTTTSVQSLPVVDVVKPLRKRKMKAKIGGVKEEAAILISNSAESMKKFYDEKLLMAREKHESKMRILALKEQILKKKLEE